MAALTLALSITLIPAQNKNAGTVAFPFLAMDYDARTMAMAGASAAVQNDIYGVFTNPAALGYATDRTQILGGYRQVMMDIWGCPLGISFPTGVGVVAPYLISLSSGDFNIIDEDAIVTGERAVSNYTALGVAWSKVLREGLTGGAALKGAYHYIGAGAESFSAFGAALDLGVQYRQSGGRLTYGAALRNVGVMYGYGGEWNEYGMPYGVEAGVTFVPRHIPNLRIALDVNSFSGDFANFEPAFEYTVIAKTLFLRGGYAFSVLDLEKMLDVFRGERDDTYQKSTVNTLSLGAGFATVMDNVEVKVDAAMQFYTDISSPAVIVSLIVGF